jgi:hypothetical protein
MIKWEFFTTRQAGKDYSSWKWRWRQIYEDGRVEESADSFVTINACIADAKQHGYREDPGQGSDPPFGGKQKHAPL